MGDVAEEKVVVDVDSMWVDGTNALDEVARMVANSRLNEDLKSRTILLLICRQIDKW